MKKLLVLFFCGFLTLSPVSAPVTAQQQTQVLSNKPIILCDKEVYIPRHGTVNKLFIMYEQVVPQDGSQSSVATVDISMSSRTILFNTPSAIIALSAFRSGPDRKIGLNASEPALQDFYKYISEQVLLLATAPALTVLASRRDLVLSEQIIQMNMKLIKKDGHIRAEIALQGKELKVCPEIVHLIESIILSDVFARNLVDFALTLAPGCVALGAYLFYNRRCKVPLAARQTTRFKDVAGAHAAKDKLEDIVDYLKNPKQFCVHGARPPRGVILYGPTGTGKTLLARALAGEAGCHFLSISGSDLVSKWIGQSAQKIRNLFADARKKSPCIIFIDEVDSIASKRIDDGSSTSQERATSVGQLLTEMDGFSTRPGQIVVVVATNRLESLDPAFTRQGRFDHRIKVDHPHSAADRQAVLDIYLPTINRDSSVTSVAIAQKTHGLSAAHLALIPSHAVTIARKRQHNLQSHAVQTYSSMEDFDEAIALVQRGPLKQNVLSEAAQKRAATRLAGQAMINVLLDNQRALLDRVTLENRDEIGAVITIPQNEGEEGTQVEKKHQVMELMAGYIAQAMVLGSDIGPDECSQQKIREARKLMTGFYPGLWGQYYIEVGQNLATNRPKLEVLIQVLIEHKTLSAQQVSEIIFPAE